MIVIPSIDVMGGKCVKLVGGEPGTGIQVSPNPAEVARYWVEQGAELLHVVDLDAAIYGRSNNLDIIAEVIRSVDVPVQVGGGVRSKSRAKKLVELGAERVVVGTAIVENPNALPEYADAVGAEKLVIALDSIKGYVVKRGWREDTGKSAVDFVKAIDHNSFAAYLYTEVSVEGKLIGISEEVVKQLTSLTDKPIIYSGGVSSLRDLEKLRDAGVWGVVVGMALYRGVFSFAEAMEVARR